MNKTKQFKKSSISIKSSLTFPSSHNDLLNSSGSEDQDKQDSFSDYDIRLDNLDNYQITIEEFQAKVESEVIKILIEIYNSKIGNDQVSQSPTIEKFQSDVDYFTFKYNQKFSVYILQLLCEKLVDLVHRCKLKINTDKLYQDLKSIDSISNKFDIEKAKNFLLGLNSIKQALVKSSEEITKVFKSPIETLIPYPLHLEEITKELFDKEFIQEDELILNLISNFKNYDSGIEKKEVKENNISHCQNEFDKLNLFLSNFDTEKFEEDDDEEEKISNDNEEEYKCASLDIDQLVQYINSKDSNNKPKKSKKKNKKRKKELDNNAIELIGNYTSCIGNTTIASKRSKTNKTLINKKKTNDRDIELFKENISRISTCAFANHKIRPIISKEWLVKIERLMN